MIHADLGMDDEETCLRELWRLNTATGLWQRLRTRGHFPTQMASFAMCRALGGHALLVLGGTAVPFGETATSDAHLFWLRGESAGRWTRLNPAGQPPAPAYGQALAPLSSTKFVTVGGTNGHSYSMRVHSLQIEASAADPSEWIVRWTRLFDDGNGNYASISRARYRHEVVARGDNLFVFGGGTRFTAFPFEKLDVFSMSSGEWRWASVPTLPDPTSGYPRARKCHALVPVQTLVWEWPLVERDSTVFMLGGVCGPQYDEHLAAVDAAAAARDIDLLSDVWALHLPPSFQADAPGQSGVLQWRRLDASLPKAVFFHAGCITPDNCVYCFGGVVDKAARRRTAAVHRAWLGSAPTLISLALDALLRSQPHLVRMQTEDLHKLGLPWHIAKHVCGDAPPPVQSVEAA